MISMFIRKQIGQQAGEFRVFKLIGSIWYLAKDPTNRLSDDDLIDSSIGAPLRCYMHALYNMVAVP